MNQIRKIFTLIALAFALNHTVFAQGVAILNAVTYREQGDLVQAKTFIDKAVVHEKTGTNPKAWYYRGLIYLDLANAAKPEGVDGYKVAAESWKKVAELDKPNGEWIKEVEKQKHNLWVGLLNTGVTKGKEEKYQEAYQYYEMAHSMKTESDTAYHYAYDYAKDLAFRSKNYTQLKKYYLIDAETTKKPEIFTNLSFIYQNENAPEKALDIIQKGRAKFPNDSKLMNEEINLYISLKRIDEAQKKIEEAVKLDPNNVGLLFNLGTIYDKKGDDEKALEFYNKAIALEPNNYDANFNMGAYYFNKGVKANDVVNKMTMKDYTAKGKQKETERDNLLKKGLSYFDKCKTINSNDPNLKEPMSASYRILKIKK